jgi:hypothetical protein
MNKLKNLTRQNSFTALVAVFACLATIMFAWLGVRQTPPVHWTAETLNLATPTGTPTAGWWSLILTPTLSGTFSSAGSVPGMQPLTAPSLGKLPSLPTFTLPTMAPLPTMPPLVSPTPIATRHPKKH